MAFWELAGLSYVLHDANGPREVGPGVGLSQDEQRRRAKRALRSLLDRGLVDIWQEVWEQGGEVPKSKTRLDPEPARGAIEVDKNWELPVEENGGPALDQVEPLMLYSVLTTDRGRDVFESESGQSADEP